MKDKKFTIIFASFVLFLISTLVYKTFISRLTVVSVIDGDTIVLSDNTIVRLIGVDTPEVKDNQMIQYDLKILKKPKENIFELGNNAKLFTTKLTLGNKVRLRYDNERRDKYGRTLAYVFVKIPCKTYNDILNVKNMHNNNACKKEVFLNEELVKNGHAMVFKKFKFRFKQDFIALEKIAQENKLQIWSDI
jgi:micrococcal nuclease